MIGDDKDTPATEKRGWLACALLAVALALRIIEYARNKALWLDEAHLALNILRRSYGGLLERLDYDQGAPLFFLWGERFMFDRFGASEYALRLIPLLASLLACALAYFLFRRMLNHSGFHVAFAIFAISAPVIRYAAEVKAYASDLLVALALLALLLPLERSRLSPARFAVLAIVGAGAVWCAFPAIFVLAGVAGVLFIDACISRKWLRASSICGLMAIWCVSFAADYWFLLRHNSGNADLKSWWLSRFMPLPPRSLTDVNWFIRTFFESFVDPLGLAASGLGALLLLLGVITLFQQNRLRLSLLLGPVCVALVASAMHQYPIMGRFLLFLVPILLVLIGEGWNYLRQHTQSRVALMAVVVVLFVQPLVTAISGALKSVPDGVRPSFAYVKEHWKEGDQIYVYHWAVAPFQYYEIRNEIDYPEIDGVTSRADWRLYREELTQLRGNGRVWLVTMNTPQPLVGQEDKFLVTCMDELGNCLVAERHAESSVFLYDLAGQK